MEIKELADKIVEILENKKGVDIELIPVSEKTVLADYFVICSGTSSTHIKALADEVEYMLKRDYDVTPDHIEGRGSARWILLDYKDVVVHVFHPEERQNYSLEKLWEMKKPAE
ncbi:MAG: ribosome silencing factor [Clostridiales bacterium]|nr:ribosome silencing factor [Clostridiales bacterium]